MNNPDIPFDAESIVSGQTEEAFESPPPIPAGERTAIITALTDPPIRKITPHDASKPPFYKLGLVFQTELTPEEQESLKRGPVASVRGEFKINLTADGKFDKVNPALKSLREAVGQATGAWGPRNLVGTGPLKVTIGHRTLDDGRVFEEVKRVRKAD